MKVLGLHGDSGLQSYDRCASGFRGIRYLLNMERLI